MKRVLAGTYCSVCGSRYGAIFGDREDSICDIHKFSIDPWEMWLALKALAIQDWFHQQISSQRPGSLDGLQLTGPQGRRLAKCRELSGLCRFSMGYLAAHVQFLLSPGIPGSPVAEVEETQVVVHDLEENAWEHWMFRVRMTNGDAWALDPTGKQFGPHWPLLLREPRYRSMHVKRVLSTWPLGHGAEAMVAKFATHK